MLFAQGAELSVGELAERTVYYRADRDGALAALAELKSYLSTCC
jgi:hypothetical protein